MAVVTVFLQFLIVIAIATCLLLYVSTTVTSSSLMIIIWLVSNNCNVIYLAEPTAVKTTKPVDIPKQCHDSNSGDVIAPDKATPCNICNAYTKIHITILFYYSDSNRLHKANIWSYKLYPTWKFRPGS